MFQVWHESTIPERKPLEGIAAAMIDNPPPPLPLLPFNAILSMPLAALVELKRLTLQNSTRAVGDRGLVMAVAAAPLPDLV